MEFCNILENFYSPQVKEYLTTSIKNIVHELPNDLRLRILDIKLFNSLQKLRRSSYQSFLPLHNFARYSYFLLNILPKIVVTVNTVSRRDYLVIIRPCYYYYLVIIITLLLFYLIIRPCYYSTLLTLPCYYSSFPKYKLRMSQLARR